jgi:hypothetical protein
MTYRVPLSRRWMYPPLLCLCVAGFWLAWLLFHFQGTLFFYPIGISAVGASYLIRESWLDWTTDVPSSCPLSPAPRSSSPRLLTPF